MSVARGQSAVVVPVAAVEPAVSSWRHRFDSSAAAGMPAHITVLYPFLPAERLNTTVLDELREVCATVPFQHVVFKQTAKFPGVLYLAPDPDDGLRELTGALADVGPKPRLTAACLMM